MDPLTDFEILRNTFWRTISACRIPHGYGVHEARERFPRERLAEAVLCLVGTGLILGGYIQWFLPNALPLGHPVLAGMALSAVFMGTGIGLYLFASRGFRRQVRFEAAERRLSVGRLNSRDQCLISRQIPLEQIESLIISRACAAQPLARLNVRLKGKSRSLCVMRGDQSDIEDLHRQLCRDIQIALAVPDAATVARALRRPVRLAQTSTARPVSAFRRAQPA